MTGDTVDYATADASSPGGRARGQTAQDFAVGIGLFLLAVAFVFAFVPQVVAPYEAGVGGSEYSQADRAATLIVGNASVDDRPNELNSTAFEEDWDGADAADVRTATGLPFTARVNVTVANVNDSVTGPVWSAGAEYHDSQSAATATRIVRTTEPDECEPACELVVRVW